MSMEYKKYFGIIRRKWKSPVSATMILFVALFLFFTGLYYFVSGDPLPDDRYFHLKYAHLLRTQGWDAVENFDWIYLSRGAENDGRYEVSLFQVFLIPFTFLQDQVFALYVMSAAIAGLMISLFYYIMRKENVYHALYFALALPGLSYYLSRVLLGRAFVLIIALVFVEMYVAIHKKYKILFFVVVFHILWHQSTYFMPLIIIGIVEMARYLLEKKISVHNIGATIGGIVVGMMFFPGFPMSLFRWFQQLFVIQAVAKGNHVGATEMGTKNLFESVTGWEVLLLAVSVSLLSAVFIYKMRKYLYDHNVERSHVHWVCSLAIFLVCVLGGALMVSGRFFDFVIPTTMLLCAMLVTIIYSAKIIVVDKFFMKWINIALCIWLAILAFHALRTAYYQGNAYDYQPTQSVAQWVEKNSDEKDKVYLQNWSAFTLMFFANHHNTYSMGIEPTTLKNYNEELYWKYYNIFLYRFYCEKPKDCQNEFNSYQKQVLSADQNVREHLEKENSRKIIVSIKKDFGAQFIVSSSDHFSRMIMLNPDLIADQYGAKSDRFTNTYFPTSFTAFKLK